MALSYNEWVKQLRIRIGSSKYPDSAVRWTPNDVDLPESAGVNLTVNVPGLQSLDLCQRTLLNKVDVENQAELVRVGLPYLEDISSNIAIKSNAALSSLTAPRLRLPLFGTSVTGASIDFSANNLNAVDIDNLFNVLALSLSTGHAYYVKIDVSGGTNAVPTAASSLARSSLYLTATAHQITVSANS